MVRDTKKIAEIVKDDVVDEKELIELPKALGYYSMESFKKVQQSKLNHLKALEKKFNISKLKATFVTDAIFIAWDKLEVYSDDKDLCMRERRNCFGIVNGTALGAHFACAGLDLTIIAGLACHASVAAVQYFALDNCQIEYERCIKK